MKQTVERDDRAVITTLYMTKEFYDSLSTVKRERIKKVFNIVHTIPSSLVLWTAASFKDKPPAPPKLIDEFFVDLDMIK